MRKFNSVELNTCCCEACQLRFTFWCADGLQTVICRKSTPPALSQLYSPFCDVAHFTFVNETCVLKVPAASVEDYKASDWAKYFKIIQAIE